MSVRQQPRVMKLEREMPLLLWPQEGMSSFLRLGGREEGFRLPKAGEAAFLTSAVIFLAVFGMNFNMCDSLYSHI